MTVLMFPFSLETKTLKKKKKIKSNFNFVTFLMVMLIYQTHLMIYCHASVIFHFPPDEFPRCLDNIHISWCDLYSVQFQQHVTWCCLQIYLLHLMQVELFCRPVQNQHMHLSWSSWWQQWQLMNWPLSQAACSSSAVKAARCIYTLTSDIISGQYDLARLHSVLLKTISDSNKTPAITKMHRCASQIKLKVVGVFFKNEAVF